MNPILPFETFVPDVEAHRWADERLYLYGSYDLPGGEEYCSDRYHVFSTDNLTDWADHGVSFSVAQTAGRWESPLLYAPDCAYKDGLYYLYFCTAGAGEGVAVSKSPCGPFRDARPVRGADGDAIDPAVFVDDDGAVYYYWGQFHCRGARLLPGFDAIDPATLKTDLLTEKEHGFHEGVSMRKRQGLYYLTYTDISRGKASCISYAVSRSPLGPFKKGGIIIDNDGCDPGTWNNHGSIAEFGGLWYIFYHRSSRASKFSRRVCMEPIEFEDDGSIREVECTTQGSSAPLPAGKAVGAWRACRLFGNACAEPVPGGEAIWLKKTGDGAAYKTIDFGNGGAFSDNAVFSLEAAGAGITVEIRLDAPDGRLLGECVLPDGTGAVSEKGFSHFQCAVQSTAGVHAVYLMARGGGEGARLRSFMFSAQ